MQQSELVNSLRQLRDTHRGVSFNPNFASVKIIKRVAENFTSNKRINVETISSVNKYIQYMIASKLVGDRMFYDKLCSYSNHLLDAYCDDIDVVDNCYDGFDTAIERHVYRKNNKVYEYLKSKHVRYLDGGIIKFRGSYDIFLPDYQSVIDISTYKAEQDLKHLIETTDKHIDNDLAHWELRNIKNFVLHNGKLRCADQNGDPVQINDSDINEYIVDSTTDYKDIKESDFIIEGCGAGRGRVCTLRHIKLNQLKEGDTVYIKNGLLYHNVDEHYFKIIGNYELIHLVEFDDYNHMSIVYQFNDKNSKHVDLIRLRNLSCDTIDIKDWEEDHAKDELKNGFVYLTIGRTIMSRLQINDPMTQIHLEYNDVIKLLEQVF